MRLDKTLIVRKTWCAYSFWGRRRQINLILFDSVIVIHNACGHGSSQTYLLKGIWHFWDFYTSRELAIWSKTPESFFHRLLLSGSATQWYQNPKSVIYPLRTTFECICRYDCPKVKDDANSKSLLTSNFSLQHE